MIVASLCYIRRDKQTLMLHRNKRDSDIHEGKYNGIGGKLESGESPEECCIREIKEETGLTARALKFRGHLSFPAFDGSDDWLCFVYECHDFSGQLSSCDEGTLHWIDDDAILGLNLWQGDRYFIDVIYQTDQNFYGKFIYREGKLISHQLTSY